MALEKVENKVSLNIKINSDIDARLKRARAVARKNGMKFNVSLEVENFLIKELKKVEKELLINPQEKSKENQLSLLNDKTKKTAAKKPQKK